MLRGGYAGTFVTLGWGMPELLGAFGGVCWNFSGLRGGGMPERLWARGGVCRNFSGLMGGYAGTFVRSGAVGRNCCALKGGRLELLGAQGGVCRNFCGRMGGYDGTFEG